MTEPQVRRAAGGVADAREPGRQLRVETQGLDVIARFGTHDGAQPGRVRPPREPAAVGVSGHLLGPLGLGSKSDAWAYGNLGVRQPGRTATRAYANLGVLAALTLASPAPWRRPAAGSMPRRGRPRPSP
ncbi:hypothetical protein ABTY98_17690 [Streptomyces sp. NPDC096040]|uniref:hypothetical protein n=1 Tax=Streptomyces sp. NPDC096040 TaxID=3155541 RepID=UPI003328FC74